MSLLLAFLGSPPAADDFQFWILAEVDDESDGEHFVLDWVPCQWIDPPVVAVDDLLRVPDAGGDDELDDESDFIFARIPDADFISQPDAGADEEADDDFVFLAAVPEADVLRLVAAGEDDYEEDAADQFIQQAIEDAVAAQDFIQSLFAPDGDEPEDEDLGSIGGIFEPGAIPPEPEPLPTGGGGKKRRRGIKLEIRQRKLPEFRKREAEEQETKPIPFEAGELPQSADVPRVWPEFVIIPPEPVLPVPRPRIYKSDPQRAFPGFEDDELLAFLDLLDDED